VTWFCQMALLADADVLSWDIGILLLRLA